ncbi:MAG: transcription elongation factor GreA [Candidatus Puniceispirillum sp.]|nr:transcription elongation factor GreA [Candidatus Pelagibacter sp.]MBA4283416.1 transcription elongation factor GreA [Candidatus Puniceispirillum sp.]
MEKIPMTTSGFAKVSSELEILKNKERPAVIKAISAAREHGDLSENAEYHAAKDKQGFIEARILELEYKLSRADVIDVSKISGNEIKFGATIKITDDDTDINHTFQIVGSDESDVSRGFLSITSPLAKAMIGKKVNDFVEVTTPSGYKSYTILDIKYQ